MLEVPWAEAGLVAAGEAQVLEQGDDVAQVVVGGRRALELDEHDVGGRHGVGVAGQAVLQGDLVVEPEGVEVDVDAVVVVGSPAVARHVHALAEELHHLAGGREAHVAVFLIAEGAQRARHALGLAAQADEVDVADRSPGEPLIGARGQDGKAAHEAQHDAASGGRADDLPRLGEHLVGHGYEL